MDRTIYEACNDLIKEYQHHTVSPDEILAIKTENLLPIPFKTREELSQIAQRDNDDGLYQGDLLPQMDLKVLHYFLTQLCLNRYPQLINSMDETSLITIGLLVEKWVQDFIVSKKRNFLDLEDEIESNGKSSDTSSEIGSESDEEDDSSSISQDREDETPKVQENKELPPNEAETDTESESDELWRVRSGVTEMMAQIDDFDYVDEEF